MKTNLLLTAAAVIAATMLFAQPVSASKRYVYAKTGPITITNQNMANSASSSNAGAASNSGGNGSGGASVSVGGSASAGGTQTAGGNNGATQMGGANATGGVSVAAGPGASTSVSVCSTAPNASGCVATAASTGGTTTKTVTTTTKLLEFLPEAGANPAVAGSAVAGVGALFAGLTAYARKQKAMLAYMLK